MLPYEEEKREHTISWIRQALARGYCHEKNEKKTLDADLLESQAQEVYEEGLRQFSRVIS